MVVNNSATVAGQLDATRVRGGAAVAVVVHVGDPARRTAAGSSSCAPRPTPTARCSTRAPGDRLRVGGVELTLRAPYPDAGVLPHRSTATGSGGPSVGGDLAAALRRDGRPISYGYLDHHYPLSALPVGLQHRARQRRDAQSAGRPFTDAVITRLVAGGVGVAPVTLHTGFSSQEAGEAPQPEWYDVPAAHRRGWSTSTRAAGGRVVAVGTTVTRALESAVDADGRVRRRAAAGPSAW